MVYGYHFVVMSSLLIGLSTGCSVNVTNSSGNLTSPNYPGKYNRNMDCVYVITSPTKQPITLIFKDFDVEYDAGCKDDYVSIQDSTSESARRIGKFCGNQIPLIPIVFSGTIFVIFKSNNLTSMSGFKAAFNEEAILDCSGYLNVSAGRIQSPNYPNKYSIKTDCEYRIVSPYNESINLTFIDFELEKQSDCDYDFLEIYDSNNYIGKFCGTQKPLLTLTLSSSIRVVFHSDRSKTFKGFYAIFSQIKDYHTTEELPSTVTVSLSTMNNTTFTPSMNSGSVNSAVIGAATGVLIGMVVVIVFVCVMKDRRRRTEKNQLERKVSEKQPFDSSDHNHYSMDNIDGHRMANGKTHFETGIHLYANDTDMIEEVTVNDDVNNEYSYSNLLTADTSNNKQLADNSYYDLSENYNEVNKDQKICETGQFEGEANNSEYIDNGEDYNILNIHPQKTNDTENYDRTIIQDVYDKTTHITNTSYPDLGLYDHSTNN